MFKLGYFFLASLAYGQINVSTTQYGNGNNSSTVVNSSTGYGPIPVPGFPIVGRPCMGRFFV